MSGFLRRKLARELEKKVGYWRDRGELNKFLERCEG